MKFKIPTRRRYRSPLTCSLSRCPRRRGGCRSLRGGSGGGGDSGNGNGGCCPTNWNWPSHRSYSRPAPSPEDGPSPENDTRPSRSHGSIVSSQKFSSIAARRIASRSRRPGRSCLSRHVIACIASALRHPRAGSTFVLLVVVVVVVVTLADTVARVATCRRAALTRIKNCGLPSARSHAHFHRVLGDSTCQEYTPESPYSFARFSVSLSLLPSLSDRPLRAGNLGSSRRRGYLCAPYRVPANSALGRSAVTSNAL